MRDVAALLAQLIFLVQEKAPEGRFGDVTSSYPQAEEVERFEASASEP